MLSETDHGNEEKASQPANPALVDYLELENSLEKGNIREFWHKLEQRIVNPPPLSTELLNQLIQISGNNPAAVAMLNFLFDPPRISAVANQAHAFALANLFCLNSHRALLSKILSLDIVASESLHAIAICAIESRLPEMLSLVINHPKYTLDAAIRNDSSNPSSAILTKQVHQVTDYTMLGILLSKLRNTQLDGFNLFVALAESSYASYQYLIDPYLTDREIQVMQKRKSFPQSSRVRIAVAEADLFIELRDRLADRNWINFYDCYAQLSYQQKLKLMVNAEKSSQNAAVLTMLKVDYYFNGSSIRLLDRDTVEIVLGYASDGEDAQLAQLRGFLGFLIGEEPPSEALEKRYQERLSQLEELIDILSKMEKQEVYVFHWSLCVKVCLLQPLLMLGLFAPLSYFSAMTDIIKHQFYPVARVCTQVLQGTLIPVMPPCDSNATSPFTAFPFFWEGIDRYGVTITASYEDNSNALDFLCKSDLHYINFYLENMPKNNNSIYGPLQDIVQNTSDIDNLCAERVKYILLLVFVGIVACSLLAGILRCLNLICIAYYDKRIKRFPQFWEMTFDEIPQDTPKQRAATIYTELHGEPVSADAKLGQLFHQTAEERKPENKPQMLAWLNRGGRNPMATPVYEQLEIGRVDSASLTDIDPLLPPPRFPAHRRGSMNIPRKCSQWYKPLSYSR